MNYKILENKFIKPDLDNRLYRYIQLPNKLKCLVIQDITTDKAAASLDVNVGCFQDPKHLPGLAHFCEHLLFMGSAKYPDESEYRKYLNKHGGDSNAYTSKMNTNYYFQVNHDNLHGALDRFSGFFSCPLFDEDSTEKEINAVDSENKKNLQNDSRRLYQLSKSLTNRDHPNHKFSTGNLDTLWNHPRSKGTDIREELLKFHHKYYSANIMRLCVLGREDLDTLSEWCYDLFHDVKNKDLDDLHEDYGVPVYPPDCLNKFVKVKPVKDLKTLEVMFKVPDFDKNWNGPRSSHYFGHLIGYEGNGSLLSYLKELSLVHGLSAGGHCISPGNGTFTINLQLTDNGVEEYERVLEATFQYIEMLKNNLPQEWIFQELKDIAYATFKFKQPRNPSSTVSELSSDLQKDSFYPVSNILGMFLLYNYNPEELKEFLSCLTIWNSNIFLISKKVSTDKIEKWYGTEYSVKEYSTEFIENIETVSKLPNQEFTLPRKNPYIATNFHVDTLPSDVVPLIEPLLLKSDSKTKLWFKKDDRFKLPKGYVNFDFTIPITNSTVKNVVLTSLYVSLVNDYLNDSIIYDAVIANLHINLSRHSTGLQVGFFGYNEKADILIKEFFEGISMFEPNHGRFKVFKEKLTDTYENFLFNAPYNLSSTRWAFLIYENNFSVEDRLQVLKEITYDDVVLFSKALFKEFFLETLMHGNFYKEDAMKINEIPLNSFKSTELLPYKECQLQRSCVVDDQYRYIQTTKDPKNLNSCVEYTIQFHDGVGADILGDIEDENLKSYHAHELTSSLFRLLTQTIKEPCFTVLRTNEQLGYIVWSSSYAPTSPYFFLRILVQGEYSCDYVESRIQKFLHETCVQNMHNMTDEEFEHIKKGVLGTLLQKFKNLGEETRHFLNSINSGYYNFENNTRRADIIAKHITKKHVIEFYEKYVLSSQQRLIIHTEPVNKGKQGPQEFELQNCKKIDNIQTFKSQLSLGALPTPIKKFTMEHSSVL